MQLLICVGLILIIALVLIQNVRVRPSKVLPPQTPGVTIPFMNIKMK
jgi:hypothetical protein